MRRLLVSSIMNRCPLQLENGKKSLKKQIKEYVYLKEKHLLLGLMKDHQNRTSNIYTISICIIWENKITQAWLQRAKLSFYFRCDGTVMNTMWIEYENLLSAALACLCVLNIIKGWMSVANDTVQTTVWAATVTTNIFCVHHIITSLLFFPS